MLRSLFPKSSTHSRVGKRLLDLFITEKNRKKLGLYLNDRSRARLLRTEFADRAWCLGDLSRVCLEHITPIDAPLALILETAPSQGILLSQLMDGHPGILTYPHKSGVTCTQRDWFSKATSNMQPEDLFRRFYEPDVVELIQNGYHKGMGQEESVPFVFVPHIQELIFLHCCKSKRLCSQREVLNAYMTSYFGAWLNNQYVIGGKEFISTVGSARTICKTSIESFFRIYPEGRLIAIITEIRNMPPPAPIQRMARGRDDELERPVSKKSVAAMLWAKEKFTDAFCVIRDEDLTHKTASVMGYLAKFLQIQYEDTLLSRSFNGFPIQTGLQLGAEGAVASKALSSVDGERDEDWPILADEEARGAYGTLLSKAVIF